MNLKVILFIGLLWFALGMQAQMPIVDIASDYNSDQLLENCYLKDVTNSFAPYVGTWQWCSGTDTLTIEMAKYTMVYDSISPIPSYEDLLVGKYRYVKDGYEVINTLNYPITNTNIYDSHPIYTKFGLVPIIGARYRNEDYAHLFFEDYLKGKSESMKLVLQLTLVGEPSKVQLILENSEHWAFSAAEHRDPEFTIPNYVILTKQ
ncbi:hypothetical protein NBRC110019_23120 [Neptunitalea chrysea]|uniref:DUF6705 domain-containing protein n=1 Tax=Neptunitalea chrysea TaxID=1647581 RepID=A0A9W6EW26_9FLAO|nr:DUF6705 family protein [Neptunitalea chrysea]GLB53272.1 hypothetical protein NBRC110019_23120 [Neptunitalea chrysea]